MVQAPIFHVNGDDPEAVVHCARIATEFRQLFHKDVVIDMFCYRRFGHNETDEPAFTQPLMYRAIKDHPTTLELYAAKLVSEGTLTQADVKQMIGDFNKRLDEEFDASKIASSQPRRLARRTLERFCHGRPKATAAARPPCRPKRCSNVGRALSTAPDGFNLHKTIARQLQAKAKMFETGEGFDWATAEALAFGTLLDEGYPVRLSGQDSARGTFSQRHSMLVDQENEDALHPAQSHPRGSGANSKSIDTLLSEEAVLGFEYGYSSAEPKALVLWEAQFGDFANGAQVVIDQFISSGEMKWLRMCGLVMLLPHGYEGQGPEHSSARLERYLQLCAQDNMQVACPTTPANYFHILRRQMHRPFRKPLILMTPKSLLRHKRCVSFLSDMGPGSSFHRVFRDQAEAVPGATTIKLVADDADQARHPVHGQSLFRSDGRTREARREPHPDAAARAALSVPRQSAGAGTSPLPEGRDHLVPGRAEEPGRLDASSRRASKTRSQRSAAHGRPRYVGRPEYASTAAGLDEPAQRRTSSVSR